MARKTRGISGVDKSARLDPRAGARRWRLFPERPSHRGPRRPSGPRRDAGARWRGEGDARPTVLVGEWIDRRTGAFFRILISLVRVSRAQRDRSRPGSRLSGLLSHRVPDRPNRPKAPTFR